MGYLRMRRFERVAVEVPVCVTTPSQGMFADQARTVDVGEGGCLFVGREFFGTGRILTVDLMIERRPLRAIAKVLYEYRNGAGEVCSGVEFQFLSDDHAQRLREFVEARAKSERRAIA